VNFISELIKSKILSKAVVFSCMDHLLLKRGKMVNIEGIVMLLDKFGTELNSSDSINKMKQNELKELNNKLEPYFRELNKLAEESDNSLPGFIKYKIINLNEKKSRGWQESKVDQVLKIKSMKEVHDEFEQSIKESSQNTQTQVISSQNDNPVPGQILNDLKAWKALKLAKKKESQFDWRPIENLYKKERKTIANIFEAFGEAVVDFITEYDDIEYCCSYIKAILIFYKLTKRDKNDTALVVLKCLSNLNDYLLDNKNLIDLWCNMLYLVISCEIFYWYDLEKLVNLVEEQYSVVYEVACKTVQKFYGDYDRKTIFAELKRLKFFQCL